MKILALETSAKAVSAAVTEDGRVLASGYQDTGLTHSRTLMPIVEHLLRNTGLTVADCDAVAVAAGPGSFTGIRIGVAAAKGLAFAADKPAAAVSTLAAMARNVAFADGLVICAMDARRSQIYNALFLAEDGALTRDPLPPGAAPSGDAERRVRRPGGPGHGSPRPAGLRPGAPAGVSPPRSGPDIAGAAGQINAAF